MPSNPSPGQLVVCLVLQLGCGKLMWFVAEVAQAPTWPVMKLSKTVGAGQRLVLQRTIRAGVKIQLWCGQAFLTVSYEGICQVSGGVWIFILWKKLSSTSIWLRNLIVGMLILRLLAWFAGYAVREVVDVSNDAVNHPISSLCELQEGFCLWLSILIVNTNRSLTGLLKK